VSGSDVIRDVIEWLMAHEPSITEALALEAEIAMKGKWGDTEVRIPKTVDRKVGRPSIPATVAAGAFADALTNKPTAEILRDHGISRSTLYRLCKKGPPKP